ncbi:TPM domain-containing protein [Muricauda sp. JGD-17]|uniref:TPM domain-containing protein n=1 Tax=Flagellimonas ochracea TaxID=2696472 RepID=A0A964TC77_9FLAO|nr:TPM domain-containing protein [Allomuricauda ochracea]NAY92202.1 TPM domain-containing protein [Allomuricauda ochracea]
MPYPKVSFLVTFLFVSIAWGQFSIPEKPQKQTSVYDYIDLLSTAQRSALEQKLIRYSDSTSTQIVLAIISSTEGENINFLGAQWGQKWGIGQEDKDNGVLVLLAKDDRRIAINTGYGVEGALTDIMSKRIIESVIIPEFKKGDYYQGLNQGADAIFQVLTGEFKEERTFGKDSQFPKKVFFLILIFIIMMIILSRKNRNNRGGKGGRRRGPDIWDMIILSNMGRSSGSSGGFGSGSFGGGGFSGGFGGGGFGGGGASGGW